jgi:hypothetical protein
MNYRPFRGVVRAIAAPLILAVLALGAYHLWRSPPAGLTHNSTALTIEQIQELRHLVTLRVPVSDVQSSRAEGWTGGLNLLLIVHGEIQLGIDLDHARLEQVDEQAHTATLTLPPPQVFSARLDHERTRVYQAHRTGLWKLLPGETGASELLENALAKAQQNLYEVASQKALLDLAAEQAQRSLRCLFQTLGWEVQVILDPALKSEPGRPH